MKQGYNEITPELAKTLFAQGLVFSNSSYMLMRSVKGYSLTEFLLELAQGQSREFALFSNENECLGTIRLAQKDMLAQTIKLHLFCNPNHHDKASELLLELSDICSSLFLNEHISRVYCYLLETELFEQTILLEAGFIKEATLVEHAFYNGRYHNLLVYGWIKESS